MENLLSKSYYPIAKEIFDYLDLKSLCICYNVSKDFRYFSNSKIDDYDYSKLSFGQLSELYDYFPVDKKYIIEKYIIDFLKCDEEIDYDNL